MCILPKHSTICKIPSVYLNGVKLDVVSKKRYLGFVLTDRFKDDDDIERQLRYFYISANMLMRNFCKCTFHVKCVLFKAYCYQLYGGPLWSNYSVGVMRKLKVAYNNAARLLLGYDKRSSASSMFVTNRLSNFDALMRKQIYGLRQRLLKSSNTIVRICDLLYFKSDVVKVWNKLLFV